MERYKPYLNFEQIETFEIKHNLSDAKERKRILESQQNLTSDDYKELGLLDCVIDSLNHLNNSRIENLNLYKIQMELDWNNGKICLFYNDQARRLNRKNIIGYIDNNQEFEKKQYHSGKLKVQWNIENGYVPKRYRVFNELFKLSDSGVITYENKNSGISKQITDLKTVDFG
jgi:hypothetical protein